MALADTRPDARERLINAGIDVFGEHGFNGSTTRMLASKAGVNLSAIPYYFAGKNGLYHEVIERIATRMASHMAPALDRIAEHAATAEMERDLALRLLREFMETMIDMLCTYPDVIRFSRIILREQMNPSPAYDVIYTKLMKRLLEALALLVAAITGERDARRTTLRAFSLIGQILVFRVARETIVRHLGLEGYSAEETAEIRDLLIAQATVALEALSDRQSRTKRAAS